MYVNNAPFHVRSKYTHEHALSSRSVLQVLIPHHQVGILSAAVAINDGLNRYSLADILLS
jgi:hypothetical protein